MNAPRKQAGSICEGFVVVIIFVILFVIAKPVYIDFKNRGVVKEARQLSEQRWEAVVAKAPDEQQRALAQHLRGECSDIPTEKISTTQDPRWTI